MRLEGKVAVITGASRGIGYAVARAFAREGARVALCGSRLSSAERAAQQLLAGAAAGGALPLGVDVADTEAVRAMVGAVMRRWGRVDVLVNNAGVTSAKQIFDMTDEDFDAVLRVNLGGAFKCTREVAPIMRRQGGGSIVNTSSMVGTYGGKMQTAYSSSKFAVNGLTKSLRKRAGALSYPGQCRGPGRGGH